MVIINVFVVSLANVKETLERTYALNRILKEIHNIGRTTDENSTIVYGQTKDVEKLVQIIRINVHNPFPIVVEKTFLQVSGKIVRV